MTANANPLPAKYGEFNIPRRAIVDAMHQAETAIRTAMFEVEALGADPLLTDAVTKLITAKDLVSDWLEGKTGLSAAAPVAAQTENAEQVSTRIFASRLASAAETILSDYPKEAALLRIAALEYEERAAADRKPVAYMSENGFIISASVHAMSIQRGEKFHEGYCRPLYE